MNFLGQASNYPFGRALRHLFATGTKKDSQKLRMALASRYMADVEDVALYHSGRSALAQAIMQVAKPGSKVIVPGLTCIAVIRAIRAAGCEPVYADIRSDNLGYDQKSLDNIGEVCYNGTIVAQNTLGLPLDMQQIEQFAAKYHLTIIEDLAHSAGRFYPDGREVGTVGAAIALSFGKGKAIDTVCGGAVVVRRREQEAKKDFKQPQRRPALTTRLRDRWYPVFGGVARLLWPVGLGKPFLAALVHMHWIERSADTDLDTRVRLTHWQAKLALTQLQELPNGPLREFRLVRDRSKVLQKLELAGYHWSDIWYDTPVAPARYAEEAAFPSESCPQTIQISQQIINLPTWFRPERIAKAREIIAKYDLGVDDD